MENVQNRVSYVKCSPDGELPGNEKPSPRASRGSRTCDMDPHPLHEINLILRVEDLLGLPGGSMFFDRDTEVFL